MLKCIWHCSRLLAKVASVKALTVDLRSSLLMLGIVSELPLLSLNHSLNAKRMVKS